MTADAREETSMVVWAGAALGAWLALCLLVVALCATAGLAERAVPAVRSTLV